MLGKFGGTRNRVIAARVMRAGRMMLLRKSLQGLHKVVSRPLRHSSEGWNPGKEGQKAKWNPACACLQKTDESHSPASSFPPEAGMYYINHPACGRQVDSLAACSRRRSTTYIFFENQKSSKC